MMSRLSMLRKTMFFLVLLRLSIGWHFFFEGWHKLHTVWVGPSETNRAFSSEGYFRNAPGPLGPLFRAQLGDPDDAALARLTVKPVPEGKETKVADRLPDVLNQEIDDYTKRFVDAFPLDDADRKKAEAIAADAKVQIVVFLTTSVPAGQHIGEYRAKLAEYRKMSDSKMATLGRDQDSARLMKVKTEAAQARKDSLDDLDKETTKVLRDELAGIIKKKLAADAWTGVGAGEDPFILPQMVDHTLPKLYEARWNDYFDLFKRAYPLTPTQIKTAEEKLTAEKELTAASLAEKQAIPLTVAIGNLNLQSNPLVSCAAMMAARQGLVREEIEQLNRYLSAALTDDQAKGAPPTVKAEPSRYLYWMDQLTMWGLTVMGGCLLLGLLTRTNCVLAAGFLLMTYLMSPPFPWLASPPNNEGNYLFVNKNLVEMLALLVLATTVSGRWFGLDAILHRIFGRDEKVKNPVRSSARAA